MGCCCSGSKGRVHRYVGPPPPQPIHVTAVVAPVQPPQPARAVAYPVLVTTQSAPSREQYPTSEQYASDYVGTQKQTATSGNNQFADPPPRYSDIHSLPSSTAGGNSNDYSAPRSNTKF